MKYILAIFCAMVLFTPFTMTPTHAANGITFQYLEKDRVVKKKKVVAKKYKKKVVKKVANTKRPLSTSRTYHHGVSMNAKGYGPRPGKWCGWAARVKFGVKDARFNRAREWAKIGRPVSAQIGAIVVWPNHVGWITGRNNTGQWIITSGNDGGRMKSRPRSLANTIAIRSL